MNKSWVERGLHWPLGIVTFFLLLAAFNVYVGWAAYHSRTTYIEDGPYEKGLAYENTIEDLQRAKDSGVQVKYAISPADSAGMRQVSLTLLDAQQRPVSGAEVELSVLRLSDGSLDRSAALQAEGDGYRATMHLPLSGLWLFRLTIRLDQRSLAFESKQMLS
ncbi:MAG: FixH family protein [Oligoflexia bacterium]|nr:FixH family protein [Oligoflexia bacterium]